MPRNAVKRKWSSSHEARALSLLQGGTTYSETARILAVSIATIRNYMKPYLATLPKRVAGAKRAPRLPRPVPSIAHNGSYRGSEPIFMEDWEIRIRRGDAKADDIFAKLMGGKRYEDVKLSPSFTAVLPEPLTDRSYTGCSAFLCSVR